MPITSEAIVREALALPPEERVVVIDRLLCSLDEADSGLDATWAREVEARLDAFERGKLKTVSLGNLLQRYQDRG